MTRQANALRLLLPLQPISSNLLPQVKAYRYMFEGSHEGLAVPEGWHMPFPVLCEAIDDALGRKRQGFRWIALSERFGMPRWEWELQGRRDVAVEFLLPSSADEQGTPAPQTLNCIRLDVQGDLHGRIRRMVDAAMRTCATRCQACGSPAALSRSPSGMYRTLCSEHLAAADDP